MDTIMMSEEPLIKKCCFVIPLRLCLQTWALVKLGIDVFAIFYLMVFSLWVFSMEDFFKRPSIGHLLVLMVVALLVDVAFLFSLTAGIIKKSFAVLQVFYFYEMYAIAVESTIIILVSVLVLKAGIGPFGILIAVVGVLFILLDICIVITVKSEMVKLRNKGQYDFSRMSSESETGVFKADEE